MLVDAMRQRLELVPEAVDGLADEIFHSAHWRLSWRQGLGRAAADRHYITRPRGVVVVPTWSPIEGEAARQPM